MTSNLQKDYPGSPRRRQEAKRLMYLLEENSSFSFLRLGDGELRFLLLVEQGKWLDKNFSNENLSPSCENALGMLGLTQKDHTRLLHSYYYCDYLDTYDYQAYNSQQLPKFNLKRSENLYSPTSIATSGIIPDWTWFELRSYLEQHRCLFCGAEAGLLNALLQQPSYRENFQAFWPIELECWFYLPPNKGKKVSDNLDIIKDFLVERLYQHQADTLFLSLGGAAKILCYELARECGIRAIDWGSIMRSLAYAGSDGQSPWRSSHHIYFERVPLNIYFTALRKAHPDMTTPHLISKTHAQLCLDLQRKIVMESVPSDVHDPNSFDPSKDNLRAFTDSHRFYSKYVLPLANDNESKGLVYEFKYWLLKKGIGFKGRAFQALLKFKKALLLTFQ